MHPKFVNHLRAWETFGNVAETEFCSPCWSTDLPHSLMFIAGSLEIVQCEHILLEIWFVQRTSCTKIHFQWIYILLMQIDIALMHGPEVCCFNNALSTSTIPIALPWILTRNHMLEFWLPRAFARFYLLWKILVKMFQILTQEDGASQWKGWSPIFSK